MARPAALANLPEVDDSHRTRHTGPPPETPAELQAAVEGVPYTDRVEFMGGTYRIADRIGAMPLLRFAYHARRGADAEDMEGMAAIYDMLRDCLDPEDWERFQDDATESKADAAELVELVGKVIELITARPTSRPSDSSDGPSETSASSTGSSPSPATPNGSGMVPVADLMRRASG